MFKIFSTFFKKEISVSPEFFPKTYTVLKEGYSLSTFIKDLQAALLVSVISFPLAMALAIASGCTPDRGLYTSVIAGFFISLFGGSRHQIAGPTAAFVVVIYNVTDKFGYEGLVIATLMAGLMLIGAGCCKFGTIIKYLPFSITTGFTTGIGVMLFVSQFKDLFGLQISKVPGEFLEKLNCFFYNLDTLSWQAIILSVLVLTIILFLRVKKPKYPAFLIALIIGTFISLVLSLDVKTIASEFGDIPRTIPMPHFPNLSLELIMKLFPSAFTIAFLAGIESLLACVVADSIAGTRHRPNCELIAQGVGNFFSVLFGGIPATGAIARTATNVRSGACTPIAGILHAILIFFVMLFFAPYIKWIPLSCLASILIVISVHMIDKERVKYIMSATFGDITVFAVTFLLTVFLDITIAIEVGTILAILFFTARMIESTELQISKTESIYGDIQPYEHGLQILPNEIEMLHIAGPFFFGIASKINDILHRISETPKVIILDMKNVPFIDTSGAFTLKTFVKQASDKKIAIILTSINKNVKHTLSKMGGKQIYGEIIDNQNKAIERAYQIKAERT
ncbi:MAG: STAS domain-containing protein [Holosporales bacterium]|jgi:SulP family sulfate permease|nr:STAS domain-containing protein [Holosporales bacterium]